MAKINPYEQLKNYFPKGYLLEIHEKTGASISLINKVLRNLREDKKGILVHAYRIANAEKARQQKNAKDLASLEKSLNTSK